jgi:hypothetical protein
VVSVIRVDEVDRTLAQRGDFVSVYNVLDARWLLIAPLGQGVQRWDLNKQCVDMVYQGEHSESNNCTFVGKWVVATNNGKQRD